jgi:hypothetical protein
VGFATSFSWRTSGGPYSVYTIAFIFLVYSLKLLLIHHHTGLIYLHLEIPVKLSGLVKNDSYK